MWKKMFICIITLVGTFSFAYAYYNMEMDATSMSIGVCNDISGRFGTLKEGDIIQTSNSEFRIIADYKGSGRLDISKNYKLALSNKTLGLVNYGGDGTTSTASDAFYSTSNLRSFINGIAIDLSNNDKKIIGNHVKTAGAPGSSSSIISWDWYYNIPSSELEFVFPLYVSPSDVSRIDIPGFALDQTFPELAFDQPWWAGYTCDTNLFFNQYYVNSTGKVLNGGSNDNASKKGVRAAALIDYDIIPFSIDNQSMAGCNVAKIKEPAYTIGSPMTSALGEPMQTRYVDTSRHVTLSKLTVSNDITKPTSNSYVKGSKFYVHYENATPNGIITLAVLNSKNEFIQYQILGSTPSGSAEVDTSGWKSDTYSLYLFNEDIAKGTEPIATSEMMMAEKIKIIESHKIAYTQSPQTGASPGKGYEYNKNVNAGQVIGKIDVNPQGVMPLTYAVESYGDNSYLNFSIDSLDVSNSSSASSLNIKIKSDAPGLVDGSLKAGNYKFCITSTDANGYPDTQNDDTKACTSLIVGKTSTSVDFTDSTPTKKSITDASTKWSEIATATPATGTKVTYSVSSGDVGLIDIDPDSGEITYKGNGSFGSVKIKATVDDDPSTGNDNYEPSSTEKEIIIFKEVGGYVKPDSKSSSITDPTFTAADENIKSGGTIGMIIGEDGTPDTIGGNTTSYTYDLDKTSTNANFFLVDKSTGKITTTANLSTGTYSIVVTVSDKWSTKSIPVTINVGMAAAEDLKFYEDSAASKSITKKNVSFTDKNVVVFATVKGSTNNQKVKYYIKDNSTNVITVNENTGAVEIKGVGKVTVVAKKAGVTGQAEAVSELEFQVTSGSFIFKYVDDAGQELNKTGDKYNAYKETFAKDKKFQVYTNKTPDGITVTYELKDQTTAMSDVISVDSTTGEVTIINASKTNQMGKIVIIATAHDPSGTYSDQSIELPIIIEKGTRVVSFADDPIYVASGKGSITPVIHVDGIPETEGKANISIEDNSADGFAWTDDTKTIEYEYSKEEAKEIQLKVTLPADRNYNIAEASGTLHIMGANDNALTISTPGKIMYGDNFTIKSTQDDEGSTNVQYTFEVDDTTYISTPTITGKEAVFDALKATGTNTVTVTVTRTADGELPSSKKVNIKVLPKPIEIIIDHKEKLKGEPNPTLTYQDFSKQLVSWNGIQDVIQANDIKLSTTAKETSDANDYPIKGDSSTLNKTYPNYTFTFKENTLTITEENIEDEWYHLELDDGKNTTYTGTWTNQDVNIISDHTDYKHISKDQSTWETPQVTVSTEGKTEQSFWMKKDTGATTSEKKETIQIDKTPPTIKTITASDTNNKLQNIINQLTGGIFFKPGTQFEIATSDTKDELDVSGTGSIEYKIYKQNDDKSYGSPIKQDTLTVTNEKAKITIAEITGTYKVCVLPKDKAGNVPEQEVCKELTLKKIDVDIDGDGNDDFNDSDGDGCPDLNIVLGKDSDGEWIKLNIDTNNDNLPDLNIDTDGDGIADINVDQDGDGIPDLNIVKVTAWNPTVCVTGQAEEYCTDGTIIPNINVDLTGDGRPDINIDLNNDGIPDIDIDTDGDGKPDINIDTNKDGTADENLKKMSEWKIDAEVFEVKNVKFQTMKGLVKDTLDQLEDNGIILEPGEGSVILPNYAIKVTEVEDDKIKQSINQVSEDQEVKKIYDVKFLKDNVETQPDGTMKIKIPVPEGVKNPQLVVQRTDGTYEKLNCILENGYLVYETKEVGIVSVLGDKDVIDNTDPEPTPQEPTPEPEQPKSPVDQKGEEPVIDTPKPTVQGAYTSDANYTLGNNMGGVSTGDSTTMIALVGMLISSLIILLYSRHSILHKK